MKLRLLSARQFIRDCVTRIPFRFGVVTLEAAPLCLAQVEIQVEGKTFQGYSSDLLVPKWFEKNPRTTPVEDSLDLLSSATEAATFALDGQHRSSREGTVFEIWQRLYHHRVQAVPAEASDRLVRGFGVALLERALIDAACRATGMSFFEALRHDVLGFRPVDAMPALESWRLEASLPNQPLERIEVRHTVGLVDALTEDDITEADRRSDDPDDHPLSLEQDIERYGLRRFKVKTSGDIAHDLIRLQRVAQVLGRCVDGDYRLTLDGNEQFGSPFDLRLLLERLAKEPLGQQFVDSIQYIEQPLARAHSLSPSVTDGLRALDDFGGVILDESDSGMRVFDRAIDLGYRGISVKNCKGVFRTLLNRGLCEIRSLPERLLFQSSEDLTNLPVVALQQDLTTAAALGLEHSERNGHHYFRGLDHLPRAEQAAALEHHSDLYQASPTPRLRIEDGYLSLGSIQCPGYGFEVEPDLAEWTPADQWLKDQQP